MIRFHFLNIFISALTLLVIAGCSSDKKYKIGVSQCSQDDWRNKMNEEIEREIMFHPEASVEIRSANDSNEKQIEDIQYFIDNDFDIIIAAPNEADAITPIIKKAYDKKIPIIVFDRNINGDSYTALQDVDNEGIGKAAANYALSITSPGTKVIEITGLPGSTPTRGRHDGFAKQASANGLVIVGSAPGNWNPKDATVVADSLLSAHPDVGIIYAHNDRMAIAASNVARQKGMDIKIIGIDAAPEIGMEAVSDGKIDATFLYPTEGHQLIRTALNILDGKPYEKKLRLPLSSAVDKSNADILLLQNESLKEETNKIRQLKSQVDDYWERHSAQTALFYGSIALIILLAMIVFFILKAYWTHKQHQEQLLEQNKLLEQQRDTEKSLNEQLNKATQSKLMFFTNVSHDLRTPLTLISEPIAQLAKSTNLTSEQSILAKIATKNVKILQRLINHILDFRKFENGKLELNPAELQPAPIFRDWGEAFRTVARKRSIKLNVDIDIPDDTWLALDLPKMESVMFNLLSNAFKYTPDNGRISFNASISGNSLILSVKDSGKGISSEDIDNIFDRFFQVDKVHPKGAGIGLSLAKALVELHEGTISVESELNVGSTFTVTIPIKHVDNKNSELIFNDITEESIESELGDIESLAVKEQPDNDPESDTNDDKPLLLIIDDNEDIRQLISELLKNEFTVIGASDGKEGIRKASKYIPDIILCDVMMPVMDGMECCRIIKEEISTSHIPILMLTACSMDEQRAKGYECGADAYLSKPFDYNTLRIRCINLVENRKRILSVLEKKSIHISDSSNSATKRNNHTPSGDIDNEFYNRLLTIIDKEMGDPELSIDSLASKMGLGRSQFYRKIKSLTNFSPVELLRNIRVKKARELLLSTDKSISEIAYTVGFSSPAYFTKCYREVYSETPSEFRQRLQ